jgi:hypothetical protein
MTGHSVLLALELMPNCATELATSGSGNSAASLV